MGRGLSFFLIVFVLVVIRSMGLAQFDNYHLTRYTDENGLPQNSVKGIARDSSGFFWLATENGLVRYDGRKMLTFKGEETGTESQRFSCFTTGFDGNGIYAMNDDNEFVNLNQSFRVDSMIHKTFYKDYVDPLKGANTFVKYPWCYQFLRFAFALDFPRFLIPAYGLKGGFYLIDDIKIEFYHQSKLMAVDSIPGLKSDQLLTIGPNLYYVKENGGILKMGNQSGLKKVVVEGEDYNRLTYLLENQRDFRVISNTQLDYALIVAGKEYFLLKELGSQRLEVQRLFELEELEPDEVFSFWYESDQMPVMIGSVTKGLFVFSPQQFKTVLLEEESDGNLADVYYSQQVIPPNKILFTKGYIYDAAEDHYVRLFNRNFFHYSIQRMKDEGYLFTERNQLVLLDNSFEEANHWNFPVQLRTLSDVKHGKILVGTETDSIYLLDFNKTNAPKEAYFSTSPVHQFQWTSDTTVLAASRGGLFSLDIQNRRVDTIREFLGMNCRHLYMYEDEIWISTYNNGIYLWKDGEVHSLPLDKNQYLQTSHGIYHDSNDYFWIPTNKGLFQIYRPDLLNCVSALDNQYYYNYFDKSHGFLTNEFNGGGSPLFASLENGMLSLPSLEGIVLFYPEKVQYPSIRSDIIVDEVFINDSIVTYKGGELQLPARVEQFSMQVSTFFYGNDNSLQWFFDVHEKSANPDWKRLVNETIFYTNFSRGEQYISIKLLRGAEKDDVILQIPVSRAPFYYQTLEFLIFVGLICLAAVVFIVRYFTHKSERENRELERLVNEKTDNLVRANAELESSKRQLRKQMEIQSRLISVMGHDIKTPLKYVAMSTGKILKGGEKADDQLAWEVIGSVNRTVSKVHQSLKSILIFNRTQVENLHLNVSQLNLRQIVKDLFEELELSVETKSIDLLNCLPGDLKVNNQPEIVSIILHNILENSVLHSGGSQLEVKDRSNQGSDVILLISDNGRGMSREDFNRVNRILQGETFHNIHKNGGLDGGLGMEIVAELAGIVGVEISIKSDSSGTKTRVFIPNVKKSQFHIGT